MALECNGAQQHTIFFSPPKGHGLGRPRAAAAAAASACVSGPMSGREGNETRVRKPAGRPAMLR